MKSFTPNDSTHLIIFLPLGQSTHPLNHRQTKTQPSSPNNYWCATNIDNYQLFQQLAEWRGAQRGLNCYQLTAPLSIVAMFERHNVLTLSAGCWVAVLRRLEVLILNNNRLLIVAHDPRMLIVAIIPRIDVLILNNNRLLIVAHDPRMLIVAIIPSIDLTTTNNHAPPSTELTINNCSYRYSLPRGESFAMIIMSPTPHEIPNISNESE